MWCRDPLKILNTHIHTFIFSLFKGFFHQLKLKLLFDFLQNQFHTINSPNSHSKRSNFMLAVAVKQWWLQSLHLAWIKISNIFSKISAWWVDFFALTITPCIMLGEIKEAKGCSFFFLVKVCQIPTAFETMYRPWLTQYNILYATVCDN